MTEEVKAKLIFGLSPVATIINATIILALAQIFWVIKYVSIAGINSLENLQNVNVPWYYDTPMSILGIIMLFNWTDYKFGFSKTKTSWKSFSYKYIYSMIFVIIFQAIVRVMTLFIVLSAK